MKNKFLSTFALLMTVVILLLSCGCSGEEGSGYTLNGVPLEKYSIVYGETDYGYGIEFARILRSNIEEKTGITLKLSKDTNEAEKYEILFGDTNRKTKFDSDDLGALDYAFATEGKKVVLNAGEEYILEVVADEFAKLYEDSQKLSISKTPTVKTFEFEKPKSVILLIGDGMGENHIRYALDNGLDTFIGNVMTNRGYCTTSSVSGVTDSAAAATALSTGYKTTNGKVGKDVNGKNVKVMGELALEKGKHLMVISNYPITDATPAGFTSHAYNRSEDGTIRIYQSKLMKDEKVIALESITSDTLAGFVEALAEYDKLETKNGFFFMNEECCCDASGHNNEFFLTVEAVTRIDQLARSAISYILKHPDTVLIMTADHETGGITYDAEKDTWSFTTTNHTGVDVPVFAMGYGTEVFNKTTVDNTDISRFIANIMGEINWGDPEITPKITLPDLN